jgi:hypothetical protein
MSTALGISRLLGSAPMFGGPPCVSLGRLAMALGVARITCPFGPLGGATLDLCHAFVHRGDALMGLREAALRLAARHDSESSAACPSSAT